MVEQTAWETVAPTTNPARLASAVDGLRELLEAGRPTAEHAELVLVPDTKVFDGRFANNGWLQELPDAITKITWDNALLISPATAREIGVSDSEVASVKARGVMMELPVYVLPGMARNCAAVALGYGRTAAGQVGNGVGADTYEFRTTAAPAILSGVTIRGTGRSYELATTQDHFPIDTIGFAERNRRSPIWCGGFARRLSGKPGDHPRAGAPSAADLAVEGPGVRGRAVGMAIDLNTCIGCNACIVACQAENNIPVVGRQQVLNQREMQWIRLDRYFKTAPGVTSDEVDDAQIVFQPMACVQCEKRPLRAGLSCTAATQHTTDGLNAMVYNRCIGTRYCSNNCPYKVRRFNFFNYHEDLADTTKMQFNPEVTVRSRG